METFYTYLWLREDGTPYYAGKGKGDRGFIRQNHHVRPPVDLARIITQEWPSESDAFVAERFLIAYYGRNDLGTGCLRNLTDGGEGMSGYKHTPETRQKLSVLSQGQIPWNKGKVSSEETCRRLSAAHKGKTLSVEIRRKISESMKGRPVSEATRNKSRESNLKTWADEKLRRTVGQVNKGRVPWNKGRVICPN